MKRRQYQQDQEIKYKKILGSNRPESGKSACLSVTLLDKWSPPESASCYAFSPGRCWAPPPGASRQRGPASLPPPWSPPRTSPEESGQSSPQDRALWGARTCSFAPACIKKNLRNKSFNKISTNSWLGTVHASTYSIDPELFYYFANFCALYPVGL